MNLLTRRRDASPAAGLLILRRPRPAAVGDAKPALAVVAAPER